MTAVLLALSILCPHATGHRTLAALVTEEAARFHVTPELAVAVMARESTCRPNARSRHGDLGLYQLRRGVTTRGYDALTDAELMEPRTNVMLGLRRLAYARRKCGGGPAWMWLGGFAGLRCGRTAYADRVLRAADAARAATTKGAS